MRTGRSASEGGAGSSDDEDGEGSALSGSPHKGGKRRRREGSEDSGAMAPAPGEELLAGDAGRLNADTQRLLRGGLVFLWDGGLAQLGAASVIWQLTLGPVDCSSPARLSPNRPLLCPPVQCPCCKCFRRGGVQGLYRQGL